MRTSTIVRRRPLTSTPSGDAAQRMPPPSLIGDDRLLRVEEVADLLGIGRSRVYEMIASNTIIALRIGRSRRVRLGEVRQFIDRQARAVDFGTTPSAAHVPRGRGGV